MEPDAEPWLIFGLAFLLVAAATTIEVVFTSVSRSEIRKLGERNARAQLVDRLLTQFNQLAITMLLLKSAGLVIAGAASILAFTDASTNLQWIVLLLSWLVLVFIQVLGETLVLRQATLLALRLAPFTQVLVQVCWPLTALFAQVSAWFTGKKSDKDEVDALFTDADLRQFINAGETETVIEPREKEMIASILELDETVVREVMVPRIDMVAIDVETSLHEALSVIIEAGHSRIPVYEEYVDHILGILYAKDLLKCFHDNRTDAPIRALLRPAYFVPVSKKVNTLLKEMQKERVHIAVLVDEYGGTAGLVTIEDLIEEIVGEIQDEYDDEEEIFVETIGANIYVLNSRLDLYSLSKLLDIALPDEDADTLGGLIYSLLGHVPEQGETVDCAGWRFTVLSVDGQRIDQVRAEPIALPNEPSDAISVNEKARVNQAPNGNSQYNLQSSD
ncbi:MAG: hemolysin family protein [Caldilineaceae bacterium]